MSDTPRMSDARVSDWCQRIGRLLQYVPHLTTEATAELLRARAAEAKQAELIGRLLDYVASHVRTSAAWDAVGEALLREGGRDV